MQVINKYESIRSGCDTLSKYSYFNIRILLSISVLFVLPVSCKKLVTVDAPATSINGANVYNSDATAAAVLTGLYTSISANNYNGSNNIPTLSMWTALSADELTLWSGASDVIKLGYYSNTLSIANGGSEFWYSAYPYIYICNAAIEGLNNSISLTPALQMQLLGEAKFMRAFLYFYLVNLYGDVPLQLSTDYKVNSVLPRSAKAKVYQQIIADLKDAQNLLNVGYVDATIIKSTIERIRPTKWAATALLARAYLYTNDFVSAEIQSTMVINNSALYGLSTLSNTFLKNSSEAIWQLQPVNTGHNTEDAQIFIMPSTGPSNTYPVYISNSLLNSFELGDQRKTIWVNSVTAGGITYYYPYKYKVFTYGSSVTEYTMMLRLGEQYLIRAEASVLGGSRGLSGSIADLNTIRTRAGLSATTATTSASVLAAIQHERQVELFTELGQRWMDLKRTGNVDAVMGAQTPLKGGPWNSFQQLYPLPLGDLQKDPNLVQNSGY